MTTEGIGPRDGGGRRGPEGKALSRRHNPTASGSPVEMLLARLEGVRKSGRGWMARCPAHPDRHASLSIGENSDGWALLTCFSGCTADAICSAVGLTVSDLFPPRLVDRPQSRAELLQQLRERAVWSVAAAIAPLVDECTLLRIAAGWVREGKALSDADTERLLVTEQRIEHALSVLKPKLREGWR